MTAGAEAASQPVLLETLEEGVLTLTLNRPERMNAFNIALHEALAAALARAAASDSMPRRAADRRRQGLLRRAGSIRSRGLAGRGPRRSRPRRSTSATTRSSAPFEGCRSRSSAPSTARPPARAPMWRSPATSSSRRNRRNSCRPSRASASCPIPAAPGSCRASWARRARAALMMLAEPIGAEQAAGLGHDLARRRRRSADGRGARDRRRLARWPDACFRPDEARLRRSPANSLDAQLDLERDLQREAGAADDFRRGRRAFLEKRPANFSGSESRRMTPQDDCPKIGRTAVGGRHRRAGARHPDRIGRPGRGVAVDDREQRR